MSRVSSDVSRIDRAPETLPAETVKRSSACTRSANPREPHRFTGAWKKTRLVVAILRLWKPDSKRVPGRHSGAGSLGTRLHWAVGVESRWQCQLRLPKTTRRKWNRWRERNGGSLFRPERRSPELLPTGQDTGTAGAAMTESLGRPPGLRVWVAKNRILNRILPFWPGF